MIRLWFSQSTRRLCKLNVLTYFVFYFFLIFNSYFKGRKEIPASSTLKIQYPTAINIKFIMIWHERKNIQQNEWVKIHVTTEGHSSYLQASCKFAGVGFTMVGLNATASLPNL